MKRNLPLTLPVEGSIYPFKIDGHCELHAVDRIDLGQGLMYLRALAAPHKERPTFINDVVRMVRPNDATAWLPVLREHYTMDDEGRAALIAEAKENPYSSVAKNQKWLAAFDAESGPYTPMVVCHNGEDLARAFPRVPNEDLSRDLYTTIGDPVPALVWPRQESEQSPTHSETPDHIVMTPPDSAKPRSFNVGDLVTVQEIEADNGYRSAGVDGALGAVLRLPLVDQRYYVYISKEQGGWFSLGALEPATVHATMNELNAALVEQGRRYGAPWATDSSPETTAPTAPPAVEATPAKPHIFKTGERVIVARKVERDSTGYWCFWPKYVETLGLHGFVLPLDLTDDGTHTVRVDLGGEMGPRYFSPEALDLVTDAPAIEAAAE